MNITDNTIASASPLAACIGLDWGDKQHAFSLAAADANQVEEGQVIHKPESLHAWLEELQNRFQGRPVALALEAGRTSLLHVLAQYPWLEIYQVNPLTSSRYSKAFTVSGAKDDQPDAATLLELVRLHRHKLTRWQPAPEQIHLLDTLVRMRRGWVDQRAQCLTQLKQLLKGYFPQALELIGERLDSLLALAFLSRWPELIDLKAARPSTVRSFYYRHNVRRPETVDKRLELIKNAVALTTNSVVLQTSRMQLKLLVNLLETYNSHIEECGQQIASTFKAHEDAPLFRELPGAGPALAPRLLAAFGEDRGRYDSPASMQKQVGVAPVREKSGNQLYTHWRWQSPIFLRQTFVEWAGQSVIWSSWAAHFYKRMKDRGKKHHVILRALAFKWIRVLWKCWQTRTPYNEEVYLQSLKRRKSPNLPPENRVKE